MKLFLLLAFLVPSLAHAYVVPTYRDLKPASQVMLERQTISDADLADDDGILNDNAGGSSAAAASVTSFLAQPDVPRNITITPGGTTTDVESCDIVVSGTNIKNASISETISFAANASTKVAGLKAFKTVTSIAFPANCESGGFAATWDVGWGDVLGLKNCMDSAGDVAWAVFNDAYESTRPTCVADADEVEKNTCDINGTLDGAKDIKIMFVQNFRCL